MRRIDELRCVEQLGQIEHVRARGRHRRAKARQHIGTQCAHTRMNGREHEQHAPLRRDRAQHAKLLRAGTVWLGATLEIDEQLRGKVSAASRMPRRGEVEIAHAELAIGVGTDEIAQVGFERGAHVAALANAQPLGNALVLELPERHDLHDELRRRRQLALDEQRFAEHLRGYAEVERQRMRRKRSRQLPRVDAEHSRAVAEDHDARLGAGMARVEDRIEPRGLVVRVAQHERERQPRERGAAEDGGGEEDGAFGGHWYSVGVDSITDGTIREALREPLRRALRGENVTWPEITDDDAAAIRAQGLGPLVYASSHAPALRSDALAAAVAEPLRLADLEDVSRALPFAPLVLKGTALAYQLYFAPELRPRTDTDLLIARDELDALRAAMRSLEFTESPTSGDEHGLRQTLFVRTDGFGIQHAYDVHWAIANSAVFEGVLRIDELRARSVEIANVGRGLSRVDALLLACVHRVAHHHDSDRLIWLYDIHLLRERMTPDEHSEFWALAAERRVAAICARSVTLAAEWLGVDTHDVPANIAEDEPSRAYLNRHITRGVVMLEEMRALTWRARARRVWQLAFPPVAFMRETFATRGRLVLPWLYVYRGVRGVARLFRRVTER